MTPRSDTVARMFSAGDTLGAIAVELNVTYLEVEAALRRAFTVADRKRGRK